jgi:hypothetical protein
VNTTSAASTFTLSNSGAQALTIASIGISGTNASSFGTSNTCGGSVAAGSSCPISVTFDPTVAGSNLSAVLTVTDNAGNVSGSKQMVTLTGTGIGVPAAGVSPSSLTFAAQDTGSTSAAQTVTLNNTSGTGPLTITNIGFVGADPGDYSDTTTCGSSLAVGASCTISVKFKPAATGTRTATLQIVDNSGNVGSTQTVALTGTGATPTTVSISPSSGSGLTQTFTANYTDPNGAADLATVRLLFNTSVTGSNACYVWYYPATNLLELENNAGNGQSSGITPGSGSTLSNNQCTLAGTGSSYSTSGNNATLTLALTFANTFEGTKNAYLYAAGATANSGFVLEGTWTVPSAGPPTVVSVSPSSGSGLTQAFTANYSDPNGAVNLVDVRILINNVVTGGNGCYVWYYPASNLMYLENNAGSGLSAGIAPGSGSTVSNNQCTLAGTGSSYTPSGNNATLVVALTFTGTFTGQKNVYLYAIDTNGTNTGFVPAGTWTP